MGKTVNCSIFKRNPSKSGCNIKSDWWGLLERSLPRVKEKKLWAVGSRLALLCAEVVGLCIVVDFRGLAGLKAAGSRWGRVRRRGGGSFGIVWDWGHLDWVWVSSHFGEEERTRAVGFGVAVVCIVCVGMLKGLLYVGRLEWAGIVLLLLIKLGHLENGPNRKGVKLFL